MDIHDRSLIPKDMTEFARQALLRSEGLKVESLQGDLPPEIEWDGDELEVDDPDDEDSDFFDPCDEDDEFAEEEEALPVDNDLFESMGF